MDESIETDDQSDTKGWLSYPVVASVVTLILHLAFGLAWSFCAFAGFVGLPVVGTLVTIGTAVATIIAALEDGPFTRDGSTFGIVGLVVGLTGVAQLRRNGQ